MSLRSLVIAPRFAAFTLRLEDDQAALLVEVFPVIEVTVVPPDDVMNNGQIARDQLTRFVPILPRPEGREVPLPDRSGLRPGHRLILPAFDPFSPDRID